MFTKGKSSGKDKGEISIKDDRVFTVSSHSNPQIHDLDLHRSLIFLWHKRREKCVCIYTGMEVRETKFTRRNGIQVDEFSS